jgi:hypothetical protein
MIGPTKRKIEICNACEWLDGAPPYARCTHPETKQQYFGAARHIGGLPDFVPTPHWCPARKTGSGVK